VVWCDACGGTLVLMLDILVIIAVVSMCRMLQQECVVSTVKISTLDRNLSIRSGGFLFAVLLSSNCIS
jgi:hypothetical protein